MSTTPTDRAMDAGVALAHWMERVERHVPPEARASLGEPESVAVDPAENLVVVLTDARLAVLASPEMVTAIYDDHPVRTVSSYQRGVLVRTEVADPTPDDDGPSTPDDYEPWV